MTEITVENDEFEQVQIRPFLVALVLAPLTIGVPALALLWLVGVTGMGLGGLLMLSATVAIATALGAPTYLLFGGPAFWYALRRGIPVPIAAVVANTISLPFVLGYFAIMQDGFQVEEVLGFFGLLGTICALIWGIVFQRLYRRFTRRKVDA